MLINLRLFQLPLIRWLALSIVLWVGWPLSAFSESDCAGCIDLIEVIEGESEESTSEDSAGSTSAPPSSASYFGVAVLDTGVQLQPKMSPAMLTLGSYLALHDQPNHDRSAGLQMHWMGVVQGPF